MEAILFSFCGFQSLVSCMADSLVQSVYYLYSLVFAGVFVTYFPASVRTSVINQQYLNVCQCLV